MHNFYDPIAMQLSSPALCSEGSSFQVIELSFLPTVIRAHCGTARTPVEKLNAIVEAVRWFREHQQYRVQLSEKQIKTWVLADAGMRGSSSAFNLENLIPEKTVQSFGQLTRAVAIFNKVEYFMRGTHMLIISDALMHLVLIAIRPRSPCSSRTNTSDFG